MRVEIWSDIACPWCYVGKRRFENALELFEDRDAVDVVWRSFELDPGAPPVREGDRDEHLARKYGLTVEQARQMHDRMTEVGAGVGIDFRFDRARSVNTFDAHRLVHLAKSHDLQGQMEERLFRAHFSEAEVLSEPETLTRLATEVGLDESEVRATIATDRFGDDVREDERMAALLGIHAVPFFVVDRAVGAAGAQPPEVLLEFLRQARDPLAIRR
jgi:predicted DsbA family dithiol-disulfide isomerase